MDPTMKEKPMTKRVECECGWFQQTDNEDELVAAVQSHAREVHNMEGVTRDQVLAQAKPV
jgi:predicted small metal-binding protein